MNLSGLLELASSSAAFRRVVVELREGPGCQPIAVLEAAKPYVVAALWRALGRPALVLTARSEAARDLLGQLAGWTGDSPAVQLFPDPDALPYERVASAASTLQQRLAVLGTLTAWRGRARSAAHPEREEDVPPLVVASARALLQKTIAPEELVGGVRTIRRGDRIKPQALSAEWAAMGYDVVPVVQAPGSLSRRGGILDVYPPAADLPARIEFFGDEVDSLRLFDPATQRSIRLVDEVVVGPPRELAVAAGWGSPHPDPLRAAPTRFVGTHHPAPGEGVFGRAGGERATDRDLAKVLERLHLEDCRPEAAARIREEIERLLGGDPLVSGELYAGLFNRASLLDYLPDGALVVVDEPETVAAVAADLERQADELRAAEVERGELPPDFPAPHHPWADLAERLEKVDRRVALRFAESEEETASARQETETGRLKPPATLAKSAYADSQPQPAQAGFAEGAYGNTPLLPVRQGVPAPLQTRPSARLPFAALPAFGGRLKVGLALVQQELRAGRRVVIVSQQSARLAELLQDEGISASPLEEVPMPPGGGLQLVHGSLAGGWRLVGDGDEHALILTDAELFGYTKVRRPVRRRAVPPQTFLADLSRGDFVVHIEHGIGRFGGLVRLAQAGAEREYLLIEYAEGDRLYVPTEHLDRVSRYVGAGEQAPTLTRLGTQEWARATERVRRATRDIARELLAVYAAREVAQGHAFAPDTVWQQEFEASFPYVETPDQVQAIRAVKTDMETARPMDRLICGDVGYGKTEVALRATFKAVMDGKQVAVLVPTTILAQQHHSIFAERLAPFPMAVEMLSRFRTDKEQRAIVEGLQEGKVDICIGTHRLLQKDVAFKNLGLLIVDEEQRFGVAHKELLKRMRQEIDVLTLTATPIPRTLHMALVGIRDMSTMETPPEERLPIKTFVQPTDDRLIREVILRELDRGGQVYFVHNRVYNIESVAHKVRTLVPEASVVVGHGQMPEDQLERVMVDFAAGKADVLVCTTIIESGLDIPNVNTIIVNEAEKFGLAQLYQLRGRVGRGATRAYAYLLHNGRRMLSEIAERRLRAIFEAADLGAGFHIAMKDLEIRGAGNLLGAEQSGHIGAVGFDLYCHLLAQAVEEARAQLRGEARKQKQPEAPSVQVSLDLPAFLPEDYVADAAARLNLYQRMATLRTPEEVEEVSQELRDRFGRLPEEARHLIYLLRLRVEAAHAGVRSIAVDDGGQVVLRLRDDLTPDRARLARIGGPALRIGTHQLRLDRKAAGKKWPEMLLEVVRRMPIADR